MYKTKKQFRLYDIYRQIALGKNSNIKGILEYDACVYHTIDEIEVSVTFSDYKTIEDSITIHYNVDNDVDNDVDVEAKLKKFVKRVNKKLKNCRKPGPRPRN